MKAAEVREEVEDLVEEQSPWDLLVMQWLD